MVQELTQDNLKIIIEGNKKVVAMFAATWCEKCASIKPTFEKMAEDYDSVKFVLVNPEEFTASANLANVKEYPTFAVFVDGKIKNQKVAPTYDQLETLIEEIA